MSTQRSAQVYITNATDGQATLTLYHNNSSDGTQSASWDAAPGQQVGPLTVPFRVGLDSALILDYWAVELVVRDGSSPGVYQSTGFASMTDWKECQLQAADAGQDLPLAVGSDTFAINLPSGGCAASMDRVGPYAKVDHVFVLMLENHSFDNIFAFSGIPDLIHATPSDSNTYQDKPSEPPVVCSVNSSAQPTMPTDPGHEFLDVVEQLCGQGFTHMEWQPYGTTITNAGYVANYATTRTEITKNNPNLPDAGEYCDVMACFDTPSQLPVMQQLATEFAICDQWFSSIPGPTWPNRFFMHGASSGGWADTPTLAGNIAGWMLPGGGFTYPSGSSIFDNLGRAGLQWRVYVDEDGPTFGGIPQVAALKGVTFGVDTHSFARFQADLQVPYPYTYTFIEPNYGDVIGGSYTGGSSQHPMDGVARGEALIKATYEALRNSPLWNRSMLVVTYDEHGGFFDSGKPGPAPTPDDDSPRDLKINMGGFLFDHYGVRVPAVVISPLVPKGKVDHTIYDHTSVLATLERLYGLPHLTNRDLRANDLRRLLSETTPRTDCPTTLANPAPDPAPAASAGAVINRVDPAEAGRQPLPESGNVHGFLHILLKTDLELANGDAMESAAIRDKFAAITTRADAERYADEVLMKVQAAQATAPGRQRPNPR